MYTFFIYFIFRCFSEKTWNFLNVIDFTTEMLSYLYTVYNVCSISKKLELMTGKKDAVYMAV